MRELELFAGAGGGIYGSLLLGHTTVCAVELLDYNRRVLLQRQRDGIFPRFPVWDDVRTFDGRPWRGRVEIVSGGFPCTDISPAGKGAGIDGEHSGLWREMARIVREVRPRYVFVENSPALITRGLGKVLGDLAALGYDCRWTCLSAADCGAPHKRDRIWILAYTYENGRERTDVPLRQRPQGERHSVAGGCCETAPDVCGHRLEGAIHLGDSQATHGDDSGSEVATRVSANGWQGDHPEPGLLGVDDGLANWKQRIAAVGNGQVPRVRAAAWRILTAGAH